MLLWSPPQLLHLKNGFASAHVTCVNVLEFNAANG